MIIKFEYRSRLKVLTQRYYGSHPTPFPSGSRLFGSSCFTVKDFSRIFLEITFFSFFISSLKNNKNSLNLCQSVRNAI